MQSSPSRAFSYYSSLTSEPSTPVPFIRLDDESSFSSYPPLQPYDPSSAAAAALSQSQQSAMLRSSSLGSFYDDSALFASSAGSSSTAMFPNAVTPSSLFPAGSASFAGLFNGNALSSRPSSPSGLASLPSPVMETAAYPNGFANSSLPPSSLYGFNSLAAPPSFSSPVVYASPVPLSPMSHKRSRRDSGRGGEDGVKEELSMAEQQQPSALLLAPSSFHSSPLSHQHPPSSSSSYSRSPTSDGMSPVSSASSSAGSTEPSVAPPPPKRNHPAAEPGSSPTGTTSPTQTQTATAPIAASFFTASPVLDSGGTSTASSSSAAPPLSSSARPMLRSPEERSAWRKQKHREMDAWRRKKETAVVERFAALSGQTEEKVDEKRDRVTTLEVACERYAQLLDRMKAMEDELKAEKERHAALTAEAARLRLQAEDREGAAADRTAAAPSDREMSDYAGSAQPVHGRTLSSPTRRPSLSPPSSGSSASFSSSSVLSRSCRRLLLERQRLYHRSHVLYQSAFLYPSVMLIIVSATSGRILDCSDSFLAVAGWKRTELVGTVFYGPYSILSALSPVPFPRCNYNFSDRPPVIDERGEVVPAPVFQQQLASTRRGIGELLQGKKDSVNVVWRMSFKVGKVRHSLQTLTADAQPSTGNAVEPASLTVAVSSTASAARSGLRGADAVLDGQRAGAHRGSAAVTTRRSDDSGRRSCRSSRHRGGRQRWLRR